jgi:hypothetical protein
MAEKIMNKKKAVFGPLSRKTKVFSLTALVGTILHYQYKSLKES